MISSFPYRPPPGDTGLIVDERRYGLPSSLRGSDSVAEAAVQQTLNIWSAFSPWEAGDDTSPDDPVGTSR